MNTAINRKTGLTVNVSTKNVIGIPTNILNPDKGVFQVIIKNSTTNQVTKDDTIISNNNPPTELISKWLFIFSIIPILQICTSNPINLNILKLLIKLLVVIN